MNKIAIIGSFKQHFTEVLEAIRVFRAHNIINTTPVGSEIIEPGIDFVRFNDDLNEESDEMVQSITLKRIFDAGVVYVVVPSGYVGRTTCYEIGRVLQNKMPIYFSSHPRDLPVKIPESHLLNPEQLSQLIIARKTAWPFSKQGCRYSKLENEILDLT